MPPGGTIPTGSSGSRTVQAGPAAGATKQARDFLVSGARAQQFAGQMPTRYKKLSAVDLYQQFLTVRLDFKGLNANGYGSSGWNVQLSLSIDASAFVLPGLMEISAEVSTGVSIADAVILTIHRSMPAALPAQVPPPAPGPVQGTPPQSLPPQPKRFIWESSNPVCLMALFGKSVSFSAEAGFTVGLGLIQELPEIPSDTGQQAVTQISSITEIPLAIGVGVEAGVGITYIYDRLYARDPRPGWYPSAVYPGLKDDFYRVILPGKIATKQEILKWINTFDSQIYPINQTTLNLLESNAPQLYINILNAQLNLLQKRRRIDESKMRSLFKRLKDQTPDLLTGKFPKATFVLRQMIDTVQNLMARTHTTDELLTFVSNLKLLIPPDAFINSCSFDLTVSGEEITLIKTVFQGFTQQLVFFEQRLTELRSVEQNPAIDIPVKLDSYGKFPMLRPEDEFNCLLKIASHTAQTQAGVQAQGLGLYAAAGIEGSYKKTAYRYQTFTPSMRYRQALVYTQDTSITYRQAKVGAQGSVLSFGKAVDKDWIQRGMTYQSACVYWRYPTTNDGRPFWIRAEKGSGLSYGVSVRKEELIACIREVQKLPLAPTPLPSPLPTSITSRRMIGLLAAYMRLSITRLIRFLQRCDPVFLENNITTPAVLLEANFAFPADTKFILSPKRKQKQDKSQVNIYRMQSLWAPPATGAAPPLFMSLNNAANREALCNNYLQAIRIRARMADYRNSETSFKLGVPISGAPADVAITLSKIEMAGQEGILEILSEYYTNASYDECVPPVAIFHQ